MSAIVEVKQGLLEGRIQKSILTGEEYFSYLGIPYAKPPIGELRFQPPQPVEKWDEILCAKNEGSPCIQRRFTGALTGSEDCLYLNVYTSTSLVTETTLRAVIVCIPGGSFLAGSGSSDIHSPDFLIGYDVVIVTINYRLHALGFLNMGTKNSADNCGLRDQCFALKWVKENIQHFGGDPRNITLMGDSSGATCIYYHMMSPKSKGLFHKAIIQSDFVECTLNEYKFNSRQMGFDLGRKLGFDNDDPEKLVDFLRSLPAEEITRNVPHLFNEEKKKNNIFHPSVDVGKDDPFLPDTIENLRKTATPVPLIIGMNNKEGRMAFCIVSRNLSEMVEDGFSKIINRPNNMNDLDFQIMCDRIKRQYLDDEPTNDKQVEKLVNVFTDYWFRNLYESFDYIVNSDKPAYLYEFTFFGEFNVFEKRHFKPPGPASKSGAAHADELPYLFYPRAMLPNLTELCEPEKTVVKNLCTLWTDFAKTCDPTKHSGGLKWKRFTPERPCFLRINTDLELVDEKLREKEFAFWNELLK